MTETFGRVTRDEARILRSHAALYRRWGYRCESTTNFEDRMTDAGFYPYLENYSDPVFRILQQVDCGNPFVASTDAYDKLASAARRGDDDAGRLAGATQLMREFLADPPSLAHLRALSRESGTTVGFRGAAAAAHALLCIREGRHADAREIAEEFVKSFDGLKI